MEEGRHGYYMPSVYEIRMGGPSTITNQRPRHVPPYNNSPSTDAHSDDDDADHEPECYQRADDAWKRIVYELYDPAKSNSRYSALPLPKPDGSSPSQARWLRL